MLDVISFRAISSIMFCIDFIHITISCTVHYIFDVVQSSNFVLLIIKYGLNVITMDRERIMFSLKLWNWILSAFITFVSGFENLSP